MTAREVAGARWPKLELETEKQRLTDSTLETGGWVGGQVSGWADGSASRSDDHIWQRADDESA